MTDSLEINKNEDGSYTLTWDREDPKWSFLNGMTAEEIQTLLEEAIRNFEKI